MKTDIMFTLKEGASAPSAATNGSAGLDLCAFIDTPLTILPSQRVLISTGVAISLPSNDLAAFIFARSGLSSKKGLTLANGVGVVDSDYRGEIKVAMINLSNETHTIQNGERIAQMVVMPVCAVNLLQVNELDDTARGVGGFGHSGI